MIRKKRKSSKYIFILKNINTEEVEQKYGITLVSNISQSTEHQHPENTTKLTELLDINKPNKPLEIISFLNESKQIYQCNISMIDFSSGKEIISLKYKCYWCRHLFNSYPIGCPINYVSSKSIKSYYSEVSKDMYTIKENITRNKSAFYNSDNKNIPFNFTVIKDDQNNVLTINKEEYYNCDGVFCSFNCCKAFIKDNKFNSLYDQSDILLNKLFIDIMKYTNPDLSTKAVTINPAPSWRLLEEYGGHLNINEFRENFNKVSYEFHGIIREKIFKPIGHVYEEKINF
jgi:hypothetical protein